MKYVILNKEEAKKITGWENNMDQSYHGPIPTLLCGYNFEVVCHRKDYTGPNPDFCSCTYYAGTPEELMSDNHEHYADFLSDMDLEPTGRVIFRGYYVERYDYEEHEEYVELVDMEQYFQKYVIKE